MVNIISKNIIYYSINTKLHNFKPSIKINLFILIILKIFQLIIAMQIIIIIKGILLFYDETNIPDDPSHSAKQFYCYLKLYSSAHPADLPPSTTIKGSFRSKSCNLSLMKIYSCNCKLVQEKLHLLSYCSLISLI
jgi:hypothetical protein